jgi:A/G-specific adenine glycosylase
MDGNVERVMSRLYEIRTPLPDSKPEIRSFLEDLVPAERPGDFAQAMMDLGATICTPKRPRCMLCPLREDCSAILSGDPELLPVKGAKAEKPLRRGAAYVAIRDDGAILLRTRPEKGLLGGMSEVPTTGWTARIDGDTGADSAPFPAEWLRAGSISHVFTHFSLELDVYRAEVGAVPTPDGWWWSPVTAVHDEALPTVMKKVIESAIPGATKRRH